MDAIFDIGKAVNVEISWKMIVHLENANPINIVCTNFAQLRKIISVSNNNMRRERIATANSGILPLPH